MKKLISMLWLLCLFGVTTALGTDLYLIGGNKTIHGSSGWTLNEDYKFTQNDMVFTFTMPTDYTEEWKIYDGTWDYFFGPGSAGDPLINGDAKSYPFKGGENFNVDLKQGDVITLTITSGTVDAPSSATIKITRTDQGGGEGEGGEETPDALKYVIWGGSGSNWSRTALDCSAIDGGYHYTTTLSMYSDYAFGIYPLTSNGDQDGWYAAPSNNYRITDSGLSLSSLTSTNTQNLQFTGTSGSAVTVSFDVYGSDKTPKNFTATVKVNQGGGEITDTKHSGTLPVIYITCPQVDGKADITDYNLRDKDYRDATYYMVDAEGNPLFGTEETQLPLQIKARGNFTRTGFSKKPFKLKLGAKTALLGMTKSKHFALLNHADDDLGYMRNWIGFYLGHQIFPEGVFTPHEEPVEVYINGDYRGLYFLTESIRVGDGRIMIKELDDNVSDPALISGGYVVELDNYTDEGQITMPEGGNPSQTLRITPDTPEIYSDLQRRFVTDQFTAMNNAVASASDDLWNYMDIDMAARYYLVMEIINHWEAYHGSTYLYRDRGENQKWMFSPLWDCGNALAPEITWLYNTGSQHFGNTWIRKMRDNQKFNTKVIETFKWFLGNKVDNMYADMEAYMEKIREAAKYDYARWGDAPIPNQYNDPLNNNYPTDPRPVADNSDMQGKFNSAKSRLMDKINWLTQQWGDPVRGMEEPAWNQDPAVPLPDYAKPGYEAKKTTVYLKWPGASQTPKVWIWQEGGDNLFSSWDARPAMSEGTDKDGEVYYYYTFTDERTFDHIKFTVGSAESPNTTLVNGQLYIYEGTYFQITPEWVPGVYVPEQTKHNLDTNTVTIYLYNKANWADPIKAYVYADGQGNNGTWPGVEMQYDENLYYGDYKGLYKYVVPEQFVKDGLIIFSNSSTQYPGANQSGLKIGGKSQLFINGDNEWTEIEPITMSVSGNLPVLYINHVGDPDALANKKKTTASFYFVANGFEGAKDLGSAEADATYVDALTPGDALPIEELKGQGSTTWTDWNKKPYKIKTKKKQQFFTSSVKSKHWLLLPWCADTELTFLRNVAGHELSRLAGLPWTPREEPVELVIDGEYQGLYFLVESIRPSENRVNTMDIGDWGDTANGFPATEEWHNWVIEIDQTETAPDYSFTQQSGSRSQVNICSDAVDLGKDLPAGKEEAFKANFNADMEALAAALNAAGSNQWDYQWAFTIDSQIAAKYFMINELMDDPRAFTTALYLWKAEQDATGADTGSKLWKFGPVWDFSGAFESKENKTQMIHEYQTDAPLMEMLWSNAVFRNALIKSYLEFTAEPSAPAQGMMRASGIADGSKLGQVRAALNAAAAKIDGALETDAARWADSEGRYTGATTSAADNADKVMEYITRNKEYLDTRLTEGGIQTGIEGVTGSENAPLEYFDTQGRRVLNPEPGGIYIVRRGNNATLQIIR